MDHTAHGDRIIAWDRILLRILICAAVGFSTVPALLGHAAALPAWQIVTGWAGTMVLCAAIAVWGVTYRPARPFPVPVWASIVVAGCTAITFTVPGDQGVWIPFLGAAAAALAGLTLPWTALLATPPILAIAWMSWHQGHHLPDLVVNVGAAVAVVAVAAGRVRQREAAELARAQQRVIEINRDRMRAQTQREELAGQLHDVLAHTLSGLIVTLQEAGLAAQAEQASPAITARLDTATALARDGLTEARRAVESLHAAPASTQTDLGAWLDEALERLRSGADVSASVSGSPSVIGPDWTDLTRSMLMEALTNTVRHAAGAPVRITFCGPARPCVSVLSVGDPGGFVDRHHTSGGHGLAGLADRARRRGGSLHYGVTDEGFEVRLDTTGSHLASADPR